VLEDFPPFYVNQAKSDGFLRPLGLAGCADRRRRVPRSNFNIVKRSGASKVANAKSLSLKCHSQRSTL
jgi:hypothetical protein